MFIFSSYFEASPHAQESERDIEYLASAGRHSGKMIPLPLESENYESTRQYRISETVSTVLVARVGFFSQFSMFTNCANVCNGPNLIFVTKRRTSQVDSPALRKTRAAGNALMRKGEYKKAVTAFTRATTAAPGGLTGRRGGQYAVPPAPAFNAFFENAFFENAFFENAFFENAFFENAFFEKCIFLKILQIFGGLVLGCIKTKFCKKICV